MKCSPRLLRRAGALAVAGLATVPFSAVPAHAAGGFTPGGLVVYRVGPGTGALSSAGTAVTLDEYPMTPSAAPIASVALPTAAAGTVNPFVASGSATSEGELTLSTDGSHLVATGYNATPGTSGVASSSTIQREIGLVDGNGVVDDSTAFTSQYAGNNIRSAASQNGVTLDAAGGNTGIIEVAKGASSGTQLGTSSTVVNYRQTAYFAGQLYASSGSGTAVGINAVSGGSVAHLTGLDDASGASPYSFVLFNETGGTGPDTAYVADSSANAILKYVKGTNGNWIAAGSGVAPAGTTALNGVTGLTGTETNGAVTLFATSPTSLVSLSDTGQNTWSGTANVLATAATNTAFRGVAFAPASTTPPPSTPEVPYAILLPLAGVALIGGYGILRVRRPQTR